MSTPTVDEKHSVFKVLVALIATGMSVLEVVRNLVALKATVDRNVNSHY